MAIPVFRLPAGAQPPYGQLFTLARWESQSPNMAAHWLDYFGNFMQHEADEDDKM